MKKSRFLAACLAVCLPLAISGGAAAQQPDAAAPANPEPTPKELRQSLDERFLNLERRVYDQNELVLRRTELVEQRIDASQHHLDRVLLIFALAIAVGFLFVVTNLRVAQKNALDKMTRATRDSEGLMRDIQRELNRPEMEHWRISQILRRLLRQLRDPSNPMSAANYIGTVREACADPYMPVSLHFIARVLSAEYDGNWNIAAQMLEQMREMDPNDPDVLLHLSHVHKNIASRSTEGRTRARHQRLSYQYFSQYTVAMQAEGMPIVAEDGSTADKNAATITATDAPAQIAPTQADSAAAATPAAPAASKPAAPATEKPAAPQTAPATPAASPAAAATANTAKSAKTPASPATPTPATPTPKPPATKSSKAPAATTATAAAAPAPATATTPTPSDDSPKPARAAAAKAKALSLRDTLSKMGDSMAAATAGIGALGATDDGALPFLPVPAIADIPDDATGDSLKMWQAIQHGDTIMTRAASAKTLRERNRMIDSAIADYTRAQSHSTNRILYHNWGVALLAKALHVPAKKRAPLYNGAVDKFLAGNVIAPHFFDFHLASLHAIIGNKTECHNWLKTARENGVLDSDALRQAPDFDSVRNEPWFDEFLES